MHGIRLVVASLILVPSATALAAPPQPAPPTRAMLTGLAGLAAWEAAALPPYVAPRTVTRPAPSRPNAAKLTGLAGLAAREAAAWYTPSPALRAVANSGLRSYQPAKSPLISWRGRLSAPRAPAARRR